MSDELKAKLTELADYAERVALQKLNAEGVLRLALLTVRGELRALLAEEAFKP